jgi:tetratricopeptide (TPR) repeat protein
MAVLETQTPATPVKDAVDRCFADLSANDAPECVLARLRTLDAQTMDDPLLRARYLRARAIAVNRLGFSDDALCDLEEARGRLIDAVEPHELAEVERTIALVHTWRGDGREAALALLRAVGVAVAAGDQGEAALSLVDVGRLEMEIGRPGQAELFFALGLRVGSAKLSEQDRARHMVALLQSLVAAGRLDKAHACLQALSPLLADASTRVQFLADIEVARIAIAAGKNADAKSALDRAEEKMNPAPDSFEAVELAHARAELALAKGDNAGAETLLKDVVARYAADNLAGREVVARLLQAKALDGLAREEERERTLAAALRRALARGLNGYADEARSRIAAAGGSTSAWRPGEPLPPAIVAEIGQRFVRRRQLGAGGFGSVWRAYDLEQGLEIALKEVKLTELYEPATRERLLDSLRTEVAAGSRINNPGVARVYGMLVEPIGDALLVEELIDGKTLRTEMTGPLELARVLDLAARIGYALAAIHAAGVVHRDLKPENIILRSKNAPVIVDFGIALLAKASAKAAKTGTVGYMAPEQTGGGQIDARADLYALGVIIEELLLGHRPPVQAGGLAAYLLEPWRVKRRTARLVAAGVDPEVAAVIAQLLAPDPRWRLASAAMVGNMLVAIQTRRASTRPQ